MGEQRGIHGKPYNGPTGIGIASSRKMVNDAFAESEARITHTKMVVKNNYMTRTQRQAWAFLAERCWCAWRNVPYRQHRGSDRLGDDGLGIEIKNLAWLKPSHMDDNEGGGYFIHQQNTAPILVFTTVFPDVADERIFVDGWLRSAGLHRFPRRTDYDKARYIPYTCLNPGLPPSSLLSATLRT
jgi:hypothetical protein